MLLSLSILKAVVFNFFLEKKKLCFFSPENNFENLCIPGKILSLHLTFISLAETKNVISGTFLVFLL